MGLTSFTSTRDCAVAFAARDEQLDLLILNTAIIRVATQTTTDGYGVHFALKYLGHALLSRLLIPTMLFTAEQQGLLAGIRIVVVSNEGYLMKPKGGIRFDKLEIECKTLFS